jgi:hypothetical protein
MDKDFIQEMVPAGKSIELIYRGSRDGYNPMHFHSKCDKKPYQITVIKSCSGRIFGGY